MVELFLRIIGPGLAVLDGVREQDTEADAFRGSNEHNPDRGRLTRTGGVACGTGTVNEDGGVRGFVVEDTAYRVLYGQPKSRMTVARRLRSDKVHGSGRNDVSIDRRGK
jgi:hypothetical protein